jgi:membrane protein implicated in regulation of membrane protease activity
MAAFRWAAFLAVCAGLLLLVVEPGTPEFVITVFMLCLSGLFAAAIAVLVRMKNR